MAAEAVSESKYLASQIVDIELVNKAALGPGSRCAECQTQIYQPWISVTYGILLCIKCAGVHRGLGVHISRIQDTGLGSQFRLEQLRTIQLGGNARLKLHIRQEYASIREKYSSAEAQKYREFLKSIVKKSIDQQIKIESAEDANRAYAQLTGSDYHQVKSLNSTQTENSNVTCKTDQNQTKVEFSVELEKPKIKTNQTTQKKKKGLSALNSDKKSTCRKCVEKNGEDFLQPAESKKNDSKKVSNEPKKPNSNKPENYEPVKVTQLNKLANFSNDQAEAEKLSEEKAQTKTRMGFFFGQSSASDGARADGANINSTQPKNDKSKQPEDRPVKDCNEKTPLVTSNDKKQDADENSQPVSSSVDIKSSLNNFYKSTIAPKLEDIGDSMAYFLE